MILDSFLILCANLTGQSGVITTQAYASVDDQKYENDTGEDAIHGHGVAHTDSVELTWIIPSRL